MANYKKHSEYNHHGLTEQQKLRRIVESFSKISVLVMADLIADEFISGEIARVSREAPVLILKHRDRDLIPGGGANAVMNLAALGVTALPVGLVGDDEAGKALLQIFRKNKISVSGISKLKGHVTTTKTRVLAYTAHSSRQQVVRIDRECEIAQGYHPALVELVASAREYAPAADAVLLSDYGYGAVSPRIFNFVRAKAASAKLPLPLTAAIACWTTKASPRPLPMKAKSKMRCASRSATTAKNSSTPVPHSLRQMKLDSLVITRGGDGMVAFEKKKSPLEIPIYGHSQVVDVTGAGDTVIATFTAALAAGPTPPAQPGLPTTPVASS